VAVTSALLSAARVVARQPRLIAAVLVTFVVGISINGVVFNVVYDALVQPLSYSEPSELAVVVPASDGMLPETGFAVTLPQFGEWRARSSLVEQMALFTVLRYTVSTERDARLVRVAVVTPQYFQALGVQPSKGRIWSSQEDASPVLVVTRRSWRQWGDRSFERPVALNGIAFSVIGVMDDGVERLTGETDAWIPLEMARRMGTSQFRDRGIFGMVVRLVPSVSPVVAEQELAAIVQRATNLPSGGPFRLVPLEEYVSGSRRTPLLVLFAIVSLGYLASLTNLSSVAVAHAMSRAREFAVRTALGASPRKLLKQTLTEAALLGTLGAITALVVAVWGTNVVSATTIPGLQFRPPSQLASATVVYIAVLSTGAMAVLGLTSLTAGLTGARVTTMRLVRASGSRAQRVTRDALVAVQITFSVLLLTLSITLSFVLADLLAHDVGLDKRRTLVIDINMSTTQYPKPSDQSAYARRLRARLQRLPGVDVVGVGTALPARRAMGELVLPLTDATGASELAILDSVPVSAGYLEAIGARLRSGRFFDEGDTEASVPVAVISSRVARRVFRTEDVIGRTIRVGRLPSTGQQSVATIVGLVDDVRYGALDAVPNGAVYIPFGHRPLPRVLIALSTAMDPLGLAGPSLKAIREVDASQLITSAQPIDQLVRDATAQPRFRTVMSTALALVAFALAIGGVVAVVSNALAERRRDSAIRVALGSSPERLILPTVARMTLLTAAGIAVASVLAAILVRIGSALIPASQPLSTMLGYAATVHVLVVCAVSWLTARAALRLDLVNELRQE
jgi:predicted permease